MPRSELEDFSLIPPDWKEVSMEPGGRWTRTVLLTNRGWKLYLILAGSILLGLLGLAPLLPTQAAPLLGESTANGRISPSAEGALPNFNSIAPRTLGQPGQDLAVSKSHSGNFQIGSLGAYRIDVTNVGTATVSGPVTLTDNLPTGILSPTISQGNDWGSCNLSNRTLTCEYTDTAGIGQGSSLSPVWITGTISSAAAPVLTNTVTIANSNDNNSSNNSDSDAAIVESVDLDVSKMVTPTHPGENTLVTYTLTLENHGPSGATGVILTDTLPTDVTFVSGTGSQGTYSDATGLWNVGSLGSSSMATLTIQARVNAGTLGKTVTNRAEGARADQYDYDSDNNSDSVDFTVEATQISGKVINKETNAAIVNANVGLTDSLGHIYTVSTASNGSYTFMDSATTPLAVGPITMTASHVNYYPVTVHRSLVPGASNNQDFALPTSDLVVTNTDGKTTVSAGQTLTYTIAITNAGSITATNIVFTDIHSSYLTFITSTVGTTVTNSVNNTTHVWELPDPLPPHHGFDYLVVLEVTDSPPAGTTTLQNTAIAHSSSREASQDNNSAVDSDTVSVTGTPNMSITYSVSPKEARKNQNLTFTVKVTNSGTASATNVVVKDTFPSYLDIKSRSTTRGSVTISSRTYTADVGTLAANQSATIIIITQVNSSATTTKSFQNSAELTYKEGTTLKTKTSDKVSYKIIGTTTLPGTGFGPAPAMIRLPENSYGPQPSAPEARSRSDIFWLAVGITLLLGALGTAAMLYGIHSRGQQPAWANWFIKTGLMICAAGLIFGLAAIWLRPQAALNPQPVAQHLDQPQALPSPTVIPFSPAIQLEDEWGPYNSPEALDKLPDYPVPTPSLQPTQSDPQEKPPDTSAIQRIVIPSVGVNAEVKYVPFDGLTWLIAGLQNEIAWLGNTSWPGLGSNTVLAGHVTLRNGGLGPFFKLIDLVAGNEFTVYTEQNMYTYRVRERKTISEIDTSVISPTEHPQLTLITCTDWDGETGFYLKRLAVLSDLVNVQPRDSQTFGN